MTVHLVCEGLPTRLDERTLNALVIQAHNLNVFMAPTGGDRGLGAVRSHLQGRSLHDVAITIEDRNYRQRTVADDTWAKPAGQNFMWRRHEIENYLLEPHVVLELFNDFRTAPSAAWASSLPATVADVFVLLQTLASPLIEDHAAEVLRSELVAQINATGSLSFGPARPAPPQVAPAPGQAQWLPALQQEAVRLCQTCSDVVVLPDLQPAAIAIRYNDLLAQFQAPAFLTSGDFLIDMGGHALIAALSRHLHTLGALARLNQNELANELLRMLARVYQPNVIYQPDDFADLASILAQY